MCNYEHFVAAFDVLKEREEFDNMISTDIVTYTLKAIHDLLVIFASLSIFRNCIVIYKAVEHSRNKNTCEDQAFLKH